jgi:RNA polymerase sigma-70 factor (ECF subfamily)
MNAAAAGEDAFLALLDANRAIVYKTAHAYARTATERDDLVQDMIAALWQGYPRYDARRRFSTWMYRVVLNVAISHARANERRAKRLLPLDAAAFDTAARLDEPDPQLERLNAFIAELDGLDKALMLLYLDDAPYRDIATIVGLSETNVATKLNRLRTRAKQTIRTDAFATEGSR